MTLSNTAVPVYYGQFREAVLDGHIPVCREVEMEMNRIDGLIANPNIYYDDQAVEGFVRYCESELTLTDGADLHLLPSFKLWAEQIFGWYYFVEKSVYVPTPDNHGGRYEQRSIKKRLVTKQYLIVARGAAKSMYAACIQAYFLVVDTSATHQITTAPTMKQAEEVMSPIRTAITRHRGPVYRFLTAGSLQNTTGNRSLRQKLAATKKGIENFITGSILEIRPMKIDKLQGLRCKVSTVDEWLSGDNREDVIGAIEQGAAKGGLDDYIIVAISSEGTVRNGSGDTIKMELATILKGDYYAPHISIWHYKLDELAEVADPAMYRKANPNIGITVTYEIYQQDVERAEKAPSTRNDILAKRFGIPMEGFTFFFAYDDTIPHRPRKFWEQRCSMGIDLSRGDDFCAFTFMFPLPRDDFGVKTRSYISSRTLKKLPGAMRVKYEEFINEGTLIVLDCTVLDTMEVYDDLMAHIDNQKYDVCSVGYDTYNAKEFMERYEAENGPFGIVKVIQGARTESVPLGELKILAEDRKLLFDESLMQFTMGHAVVKVDTNGNQMLHKLRQEDKIDNVSALMDAYVAWKLNKEAFE